MPKRSAGDSATVLFLLCLWVVESSSADGSTSAVEADGVVQDSAPYVLASLIKTGPGNLLIDVIANHDYAQPASTAPISTYREAPPLAVRAYNTVRPKGDARAWLDSRPDSAESKLDRYVLATYPDANTLADAMQKAQQDPQVEAAYPYFSQVVPAGPAKRKTATKSGGLASQPHIEMLRIPAAQELAEGWALVGLIDNGVAADHPGLRSQTGSASSSGALVHGGALLPYFSANLGSPQQDSSNLSESQPQLTQSPAQAQCDADDGAQDGHMNIAAAGHGTHVAGLVGANASSASGLRGTCRSCAIGMIKASALICNYAAGKVATVVDAPSAATGVARLVNTGAQVISMSLGLRPSVNPKPPICDLGSPPADNDPLCLQIRAAHERDIVLLAASGNDRSSALNFPARDPRVIAVGGVDASKVSEASSGFWDDAPNDDLSGCPFSNPGLGFVRSDECGSNYSVFTPFDPTRRAEFRQETVAPAKAVVSIFPPGKTWNSKIGCGDAFGAGAPDDGRGDCTGTSMAAPIVGGIVGLLRSTNPLVPAGDPFDVVTSTPGIRDALAHAGSRSLAGLPWDSKLGYGTPDAAHAVAEVLGRVQGEQVPNRATPLFLLYDAAAQDYAMVASPQLAMSLATNQAHNYASDSPAPGGIAFVSGGLVRGYPSFPNQSVTPRAIALVLTTRNASRFHAAIPVPLHMLDRCANAEANGCGIDRDFILLTDAATINLALANGYRYAGRQGYIYPRCTPEPMCQPPGTERLYLECSVVKDDCAVFPESRRSDFESSGAGTYIHPFPGGEKVLGYAYSLAYSDADDLPDGFEHLIGTSAADSDSDKDGIVDSAEYPQAGLPMSDPCVGNTPTSCPLPLRIFRNGFEEAMQ